jgi:hypothetical protein
MELNFRADGTADFKISLPNAQPGPAEPAAPFPITWELSDDRVLSVWFPIQPMPEYEMPDWTRDALHYDVLAVSAVSLTISDRRFDGEEVTVLRRVNDEEYRKRELDEIGSFVGSLPLKTPPR